MTVITLIKKILLWGILLTAIVLIAGVYRFLYGFGAVTTLADMSANRERALAAFGNADQSMNALLSLADDDQGYRPLFDGETLAGWHGAPGYWRVAGGEIVGESKQVLKIPQYLVSDTVADNFSIKFDFLVDGDSFANSGLFYRVEVSDMAGNPPINAYQADIDVLGFTHWAGAFYHEHGPGEGSTITFTGERVWVDPDGGRVLIKPLGDPKQLQKLIAKGKWSSYTIVAKEGRFIHRIDGTVFSDTLLETVLLANGVLALQLHPGPPMQVRFRNLRIKQL